MAHSTKRVTHEEFVQRVFAKYKDEIVVEGEYINNRSKVKVFHKRCGSTFLVIPKCLLRSKFGCETCARELQRNKPRKTNEEFIHDFYEHFDEDDYSLLSEYETSRAKVKVRHNICGTIFYATANNLTTKHSGCPSCKCSKGELAIKNFLDENDFIYKREVKFDGCSYRAPLRFDFVVYNEIGNEIHAIEFDGEQHFLAKEFFGGERVLAETRERDEIKDQFCESRKLNLIRIPYYQANEINSILTRQLEAS